MSLQTCWRCLARASSQSNQARRLPQQPWNLYPASMAAFTTSTSLSALPAKKKGKSPMIERNVKGAKQTFVKKKKKPQAVDSSRRPAPGERRALRKRIVLSNTNALEVEGLKDITGQSMIDESLQGQVLGIPGPVVDQLRAVEAFKVTQGWPLFRRPAMLMRKGTLEMATEIENISLGTRGKTIRRVFVGERGSGKTTMLLQAMTMAFLKGWVVINIPEGTRRVPLSCALDPFFICQADLSLSPRPHPRPHRIRPPPLHHPNPLHPTHLHRLPPQRYLPRKPHPPISPALPTTCSERTPHPHPPNHLPLQPRSPRRSRLRNRLAHIRTAIPRTHTPESTTLITMHGRTSARDEKHPLHIQHLPTNPRPPIRPHQMVPRPPLRRLPAPKRRPRPRLHLRIQQPRHPLPQSRPRPTRRQRRRAERSVQKVRRACAGCF